MFFLSKSFAEAEFLNLSFTPLDIIATAKSESTKFLQTCNLFLTCWNTGNRSEDSMVQILMLLLTIVLGITLEITSPVPSSSLTSISFESTSGTSVSTSPVRSSMVESPPSTD